MHTRTACQPFLSLMLPRKGQPFPPERRNCSHTFRGVLQFWLPSAPQRYNTLDFPGKVVCHETAGFFGFFRSKGNTISSEHPTCSCSGYPSYSHTMDVLPPEQVKQAQRLARIAGRFCACFCSAAAGQSLRESLAEPSALVDYFRIRMRKPIVPSVNI